MTEREIYLQSIPTQADIEAGLVRARKERSAAFHRAIAKFFNLFHHVATDRPVLTVTGRPSSSSC